MVNVKIGIATFRCLRYCCL